MITFTFLLLKLYIDVGLLQQETTALEELGRQLFLESVDLHFAQVRNVGCFMIIEFEECLYKIFKLHSPIRKSQCFNL